MKALYLGATVEIISSGGVHEALREVNTCVDAPRKHQLACGIYHLGTTRDHQLFAHLLNDAVLNVHICFLGKVIIHHFASLYEDAHRRWASRHDSTCKRAGETNYLFT